jgi:hypothetical protein
MCILQSFVGGKIPPKTQQFFAIINKTADPLLNNAGF